MDLLPHPEVPPDEAAAVAALSWLAARNAHKLHRCADCLADLPDDYLHSNVCPDCAARRFELFAA